MYQPDIWRDITTSVQQALDGRLDLLSEASLVHRSDVLLASLPSVSGAQPPTTAVFLRRYHTRLQQELCRGDQPRTGARTLEDDLRELTRAMVVTVGVGEGVSVEVAVGVALVLYKRGIVPFCALPSQHTSTA